MQLCFDPLDLKLRDPWSTSRTREGRVARTIIVTLEEEGGAVGWGEVAPISRYGETVDSAIAFLECVDVACLVRGDIHGSMAYLDSLQVGERAAKSALNCALLDLAAQNAG